MKMYRTTILPMAVKGGEGISAMGIDAPLAVLSDKSISRYLIILSSYSHR